MKRLIPLLFASLAHAAGPQVIEAPVDHLFVPSGFDNNDNVEVVVTGYFPNSCYSRNKVDVSVVGDLVNIHVTSLDKSEKGMECVQVLVPFKEVVTVGNLQAGEYRLVVNGGGTRGLENKIRVDEAQSRDMDDHLYALIDFIDTGFTNGAGGSAILAGQRPSYCLEFDHVEYVSNGTDTLSILPIMKKVSDFCPMKMMPMRIPIKFDPASFSSDKILLFSRTIDGKSVSTVISR